MPSLLISLTAIFFAAYPSPRALAADQATCDRCLFLNNEMSKLGRDEAESRKLLAANEKMKDDLPLTKISARIKLSSNISVINTRLDLLTMTMSGKSDELKRLECDKCPKTKQ